MFIYIVLFWSWCSALSITSSDFKTTNDFSTIISKISAETDSNGRNFLDWSSSVTLYQDIVADYPYIAREFKTIGKTELNENIYALHMSYQYTVEVDSLGLSSIAELIPDTSKPSIVIIGGHLGNSMISHSYILALIGKLIHGFHNKDSQIISLLKLRHIWFVPYLNIDTYKYIQSYSGDITDVQNLVKSRKVEGSWSELDTGTNLMNNYDYQWGIDNFGSSDVEWMSTYRGSAAFSSSETQAISALFNDVEDPTIVLSIDSSKNFIKYPANYANDKSDAPLSSSNNYWFYKSLIRELNDANLGISMGNYVSLFLKTNNGDNDDYFLFSKYIMSYSWSIGYQGYGYLYLNNTSSDKISKIILSNLDFGLYSIEKSGEQIAYQINSFDIWIPTIEEWNGYEPENGIWKFYLNLYIFNSGMKALSTQTLITLSFSNNMYFESNSYSSQNSVRRNLVELQTTIVKNTFSSKETDVIKFSAVIVYNSNGDSNKDASSLGDINLKLTYYDFSYISDKIRFNSYSSYNSKLDKYYYSVMKRSTFILFVIFWWWIFLHSIFLILQIKFNVIALIIKKIKSRKGVEPTKEITTILTKEDDAINLKETMDENISGFDKSIKDSITRSNIDLISRINQELNSIRSSRDKEFTKDDDSGEIWEYQAKGKILLISLDNEMKIDQRTQNFKQSIEPVQEDPHEEDMESEFNDNPSM